MPIKYTYYPEGCAGDPQLGSKFIEKRDERTGESCFECQWPDCGASLFSSHECQLHQNLRHAYNIRASRPEDWFCCSYKGCLFISRFADQTVLHESSCEFRMKGAIELSSLTETEFIDRLVEDILAWVPDPEQSPR
ncbi:hypothetical protein K474DRAFT_1680288 [Panus rudis PR-1116 ss-1]|nr:hypothetical protein K474DRAFT_1680288 [Panus rudis PR-1116 ss-1]